MAARRLSRRQKQLLDFAHYITSVAWLGAVLCILAIASMARVVDDPETRHAAYAILADLDTTVMIPMALGALFTGVLLAVLTKWGLTRFWWVLVKLVVTVVLTGGGTFALHQQVQEAVVATASGGVAPAGGLWLVVANGVKVALLAALVLISVMKPWDRTPWGERALVRGTQRDVSER